MDYILGGGTDQRGAWAGLSDWPMEDILIAEEQKRKYAEFLKAKQIRFQPAGFNPGALNPKLFDWQQALTRLSLRKGRFALFEDCGLGKTCQQLEWAHQVAVHTKSPVILYTPLAVAEQTVAEAEKFGIQARLVSTQMGISDGVNVTNYEKLHKFSPVGLGGVVLDESSILKGFDGATRAAITEFAREIPYRLCCTATPAPNDYMELGNHAEFLGIMRLPEMLATFFVHDGGDTSKWRLKKHAVDAFWKWMCSWSVFIRKPSDIGYSDEGFTLPELRIHQITVPADLTEEGLLFPVEAKTMAERRGARKASIDKRVEECAHLVNHSPDQWIVWANLNAESEALTKAIDGAVEVTGSDSDKWKKDALAWFVGNSCICQFSDKLSLCPPIQNTSASTMPPIENAKSGSPSYINGNTRRSERRTSKNGTLKTSQRLSEQETETEKKLTPEGERCTLPTNLSVLQRGEQPKSGKSEIQSKDLRRDSGGTELPSSNTELCLNPKETSVPYAGCPKKTEDKRDSISTTAMPPERYEECSARTATWESGNSGITQSGLNQQQCICGRIPKRIVSKPTIWGYGLNLQNCHKVIVCGLSDSWEQFYQLVRRCYRFGQKHPVDCYVIVSETEGAVVRNIQRKEEQARKMAEGMLDHMKDEMKRELQAAAEVDSVPERQEQSGEGWRVILNDSIPEMMDMADASVGYSIFSPPFASLYTYSQSDRDMGNCRSHAEFYEHMGFLIPELYRTLIPGRLVSFHCMNLPMSKERDGEIGQWDFRGNLIRMFQTCQTCGKNIQNHHDAATQKETCGKYVGFIFHSEVCIWKDPVTAMQRTKALGLLHKQIVKDSCMSRQGIPDYLVTMRKPGKNAEPVSGRFDHYVGENGTGPTPDAIGDRYSIEVWQRYASPVWMDINPSDTLQKESAREQDDERHICPLQLQVIERAMDLWSNPDDLVLSPFAGIGSEGYVALQNGRRFLGVELKESYWEQACANLRAAQAKQTTLFAAEAR